VSAARATDANVALMAWTPSPSDTPFARLGGEPRVRALAKAFYDRMDEREPELARLHELGPDGKVSEGARERFTLFLIEWLGGPRAYSPAHGHPRLRMRHARVRVDVAMRDAWLRCMRQAMQDVAVDDEARAFLDQRFAELADFLRNAPG